AASAVKNILHIINDTGQVTHSPAPNGLPGGYPVRLSAAGAEVVLPHDLTLEEAIKINEEAQKYDGIESIEEDGTIIYTDKAYNVMRDMIGYDCKKMKVEETEERSNELGNRFKEFVKKVGKGNLVDYILYK
ncbi:MAG: hypothetical protein ACOYJ1_11260, partial [Peptococcales bacterium]